MGLRDEFRTKILSAGNTQSTFETYWPHVEGFVRHTRRRRQQNVTRHDVTEDDVFAWRDHLTAVLHLSPKSTNQAISAVKFLFTHVIGKPLAESDVKPLRVREPKRQRRRMIAPSDIAKLLSGFPLNDRIVSQLQYASVSRLDDVLNLRIKDLNFADQQIEIAQTKHNHFRVVPFPSSIHDAVKRQMDVACRIFEQPNPNGVPVPYSFAKKCSSAPTDWRWFWLFPSGNLSTDPIDGKLKRYHRDADHYRRIFRDAVRRAGITRRITPHDMRRSAATHLHKNGMPLMRLMEILGHTSVQTTQLYIFADDCKISGTDSPFDLLEGFHLK
jgi:site-specific recombinase XerD